ncbi:hypothetical protein KFE25_009450 [Diacronema lutheri]|uniref:Uncharacterized protein n=1 Tax=Diacronema lutheri TaxID=2081491 RepID=A0A8J5XUU8_DIALT|nr:hypothetical protein KFE25_009450 [Diacronema lutheri]
MSQLNERRQAHMCGARGLHDAAAQLLLRNGVEINAAGIDFTPAILRGRLPSDDVPRLLNQTAPLLELYIPALRNLSKFAPRRVLFNDPQHMLVHARRFLEIDVPVMYAPAHVADAILGTDSRARGLYETMQRDGVARVERFDGLDVAALRAVAVPILDRMKQDSLASIWKRASVASQPIMHEWLTRNLSLRRALGAYIAPALGKPLSLSAMSLMYVRVAGGLTSYDRFPPALWHNDRTGRRIKVIIFLNPVSSISGRPTRVALGSHRILHFSRLGYVDSRYDDAWIHEHYEVATIGGEAGGGLVLDVNALHRASLTGETRDAVVVEMIAPQTCACLAQRPPYLTFDCDEKTIRQNKCC